MATVCLRPRLDRGARLDRVQTHTGPAVPSLYDRDGSQTGQDHAPGPVRTCVGCRGTGKRAELVRLVRQRTGPAEPGPGHGAVPVVVDERKRLAGRGAWIHPEPRCLELAERRRAPARALRLDGPADLTAVRSWMKEHEGRDGQLPAAGRHESGQSPRKAGQTPMGTR
ncbi:DUF448 domain-containing protein [Flavimobilis soli]|uniref:DUF448 domain-containing protein n=1 Tax=Flavimobilis soli TaxID=442709 RepID=UPI000BF5EDDE